MPGNEADYVLTAGAETPDGLTPADAGVPIEKWGKDHWSVFMYVESICVNSTDGIGSPDHRRIQTNHNRHPEKRNNNYHSSPDGADFGIRLNDGTELPGPDYDEWDCIRDLECYGFLRDIGTGIRPLYRITEKGNALAAALRKHKTGGGMLVDFRYTSGVPA